MTQPVTEARSRRRILAVIADGQAANTGEVFIYHEIHN